MKQVTKTPEPTTLNQAPPTPLAVPLPVRGEAQTDEQAIREMATPRMGVAPPPQKAKKRKVTQPEPKPAGKPHKMDVASQASGRARVQCEAKSAAAGKRAVRFPPTPLDSIASEIRREHQAVMDGIHKGLEHARDVGKLLLDAKEMVKKLKCVSWTTWVEKECRFGIRTAQNYMRIAKHWKQIERKTQSVADLAVNSALKLVAKPKAKGKDIKDAGGLKPQAGDGDISSDGTGAPWALDDSPDVGEEIERVLRPLSTSLSTVLSNRRLCDRWDAKYKVELADRLTEIADQATAIAAVLRASVTAKQKATEAAPVLPTKAESAVQQGAKD